MYKSNMKVVVITGGRGYLGKNIIKELRSLSIDVISIYSDKVTAANPTLIIDSHINVYKSFDVLLDVLKNYSDVTFLHFTTEYTVGSDRSSVTNLIEKNVLFGLRILDFMTDHGYSKIIVAESYWQFDLRGQFKPFIPYSMTKTAFSMICECYNYVGLKPVYLVLNDVYGPRDERKKLINLAIHAATNGMTLNMTSGEQILDFVYIDDVVDDVIYVVKFFDDIYKENKINRYSVTTRNFTTLKQHFMSVDLFRAKSDLFKWGRIEYRDFQIFNPWIPRETDLINNPRSKLTFNAGVNRILETLC